MLRYLATQDPEIQDLDAVVDVRNMYVLYVI
jgi:hypothetical protein